MPDQVIDPAAIDNLRALSPDTDGAFLRELIEIFLQDTPERFTELDATLAKGDAPAAMRAAHTIKGSSGNFGATRLARLAQEVEAHAKAGDLPAASAVVPDFKAEYAKVAAALTRISQGT